MYYNNNDKIIIKKLPKNFLKSDGTMLTNFHLSNIDLLSDYGFFTIRNDNNTPPTSSSVENISQRQVMLNKPYCDITRIWTDITIPLAPTILPSDQSGV
jgi:hypothetical protein